MGFSYNKTAGDTLKKISALNGFSNAIRNKDGRDIGYFTVSSIERPDGGIIGTVYKFTSAITTKNVGRFSIDGDGSIEKFPLINIKEVNATAVGPRELSKAVPF